MFRERTFRVDFVAVSLITMLTILVLSPLTVRPSAAALRYPPFWIGTAALFGWVWLTMWAACWFFTTSVGPDGVRSYNAFGWYANVRWADMGRVRRVPAFVIVHHPGRSGTIWVPSAFVDLAGIAAALREFAPEDNPLRQAFERYAGT